MEKYELVTILDAGLPQDDKEAVIKEVSESIAKCDGKVINTQVWLEKHKFSFQMRKKSEGTYYLTNFESPAAQLTSLRQALRLKDRILRSLIIRVG